MKQFSFLKYYGMITVFVFVALFSTLIVPELYKEQTFSLRGRHSFSASIMIASFLLGAVFTFITKWIFEIRNGTFMPKPQKISSEYLEKNKGLGGWLILVGLSLISYLAVGILSFWASIVIYAEGEYLSKVEFIWDIFSAIIIIASTAYGLLLFFKKKRKFSRIAILTFMLVAACNIITFIILLWNQGWSDGDYAFSSLKAVVKSIFWTIYIFLYLKNSRRAQATFVEA